mmetsp:Transcript_81327/g.143500  ORF Transcript_81327/g.143500 Transcript_81327/m.143500 type:complete len:372 (-) Transcript_81327:38-1153(-)
MRYCSLLACILLADSHAELQVGSAVENLHRQHVTRTVSSNGEVHMKSATLHAQNSQVRLQQDKVDSNGLRRQIGLPRQQVLGGAARTMRTAQSLHEVGESSSDADHNSPSGVQADAYSAVLSGDSARLQAEVLNLAHRLRTGQAIGENCVEFPGKLAKPEGPGVEELAESWEACLEICSVNKDCQQVQWSVGSKETSCTTYTSWNATQDAAGILQSTSYKAAVCNPPEPAIRKMQKLYQDSRSGRHGDIPIQAASSTDGNVQIITWASHWKDAEDKDSKKIIPFSGKAAEDPLGHDAQVATSDPTLSPGVDKDATNLGNALFHVMRKFFTFPTWAVFMGCALWVTATVYSVIWLQIFPQGHESRGQEVSEK